MDGLSAGASIIAIVSLAFQLLETVREVHSFLRKVSDAPKELMRLIDLLEQLELIIENISLLMERQRQHNVNADDKICTSVYKALRTCQTKLTILNGIVNKANVASDGKRKIAKSLGSFRLACKKKDVEEFETQLQHAVTILDLTMTMNLTVVHSQSRDSILQASALINNQGSVLCEKTTASPRNLHGGNFIGSTGTRKSSESMSKSRELQVSPARKHSTPFGNLYLRRRQLLQRRQISDDPKLENRAILDLAFMPSFLSRCVRIRCSKSFGHIDTAIRTYPVIPCDHPALKMCQNNDVLGLQSCFSTRSLSPYSINEIGCSLLHIALERKADKICEMLFQMGLEADATDNNGAIPSQWLHFIVWEESTSAAQWDSFVNCCRLVNTYSTYMPDAHPFLFHGDFNLSNLELLINAWVTEENVNDYAFSPLEAVGNAIMSWNEDGICSIEDYQLGCALIQKLVRLGVTIYRRDCQERSFFQRVVGTLNDILEVKFFQDFWLDALSLAGVDIDEYARLEAAIWKEDEVTSSFNFDETMVLLISLREAFVVFLGRSNDLQWPLLLGVKDLRHAKPSSWPFNFPDWQLFGQDDERFRRQRSKKIARLGRAQGLSRKRLRMPGAWIQ